MITLSGDPRIRRERARAALEGLSLGDAFGAAFLAPLPTAEARIARRRLPAPPWRYTDETEMALGLCEVLDRFGRVDQDRLAGVLVRRFASHPDRGYGAVTRLTLEAMSRGETWSSAAQAAYGGPGSMGSGAAARVAPLGAYFADDYLLVVEEARRSAAVTHFHAEGVAGAVAVAVAAAFACRSAGRTEATRGREMLEVVLGLTPDGETRSGVAVAAGLPAGIEPRAAGARLGNGSDGNAPKTVPFSLWTAAHHLDRFEEALWTAVAGLGACDTIAAIVGGIVATSTGVDAIPLEWRRCREPIPGR